MNNKNKIYLKKKINTSVIFPVRTCCKFCLSYPEFYYRVSRELVKRSPSKNGNQFYTRSIINYPLSDYTIEYRKLSINEHSFSFNNKFNVKFHREKNISNKNNYDDYFSCKCGKTFWVCSISAAKNRKEISMRHSRQFFNKEFYD